MTTIFDGVKLCATFVAMGESQRDAIFLTQEEGDKIRDELLKDYPAALSYVRKLGAFRYIGKEIIGGREFYKFLFYQESRLRLVQIEAKTGRLCDLG